MLSLLLKICSKYISFLINSLRSIKVKLSFRLAKCCKSAESIDCESSNIATHLIGKC